MKKDIDTQFLCKDCERYNLCEYYHNRKQNSYICKYFHLPNKLDKIRAEIEQITDTMGVSYNQYVSKIDVLQIIDKYKANNAERTCSTCKHSHDEDNPYFCITCNDFEEYDNWESEV